MSGLVLFAHADPGELAQLAAALRADGWIVLPAESPDTAAQLARAEGPDVAWLDGRLIGDARAGADLLAALDESSWPAARVLVDWPSRPPEGPGLATTSRVVAAAEARALVARVDRERRRSLAARALGRELDRRSPAPLVGRSPALRRLRDQVDRIAATPQTTVLLLGEPGTGRLEIARRIHERSAATGPLIEIACRLPGRAFELELCGSALGSRSEPGALAQARAGTLVLRDVEALSQAAQERLLELTTERTWRAIGSDLERPLDARLIALGAPDLEAIVDAGAFREDLFYRLNVLSSAVPPLRERPQDVEPLVEHHLAALRALGGAAGTPSTVQPAALEALKQQAWPGNGRELSATVERAAWLAGDQPIRVEHLGLLGLGIDPSGSGDDRIPIGDGSLRGLEERLIRHLLARTGGNRSRTARLLGVNRTTLYNKLRAYGID